MNLLFQQPYQLICKEDNNSEHQMQTDLGMTFDHDVENLRIQLANIEKNITSVLKEKQNLIRSIAKGILTDDDVAQSMLEIRERENLLLAEASKISPQLENILTKKKIERSIHNYC